MSSRKAAVGCLRTGKNGREVKNDATTGYEVHVEHHGRVVVWDMRLSVACTATDAEFQNSIIIRDHTMNLLVVALAFGYGSGYTDPNHAPHTAPRPPVAGAPNRKA
jgi:hypothetical protein